MTRKEKTALMMSEYKSKQKEEKDRIKAIKKFWPRLWANIVFWLLWPWKWCWVNFRDPFTLLIFLLWFLLLSSEVWFSYLMGIITWGTQSSAWWLGIANACWIWWLLPTPESNFMVYCILLTIGTKALIDRIRERKAERREAKNGTDD